MGFGGSAQAMITIIKNNEKMRSSRKKFKKNLGGYEKYKKPEYNLPNATPQILSEIKERLERERKLRILKITVFILLVSILTIVLISYL